MAILWLMFSFDGRELAAVFVGGALGTLARAALATVAATEPGHWPWPTFIVNIVGAFLLGYFTTRLLERLPVSSYRRPLLGTGLCGGQPPGEGERVSSGAPAGGSVGGGGALARRNALQPPGSPTAI